MTTYTITEKFEGARHWSGSGENLRDVQAHARVIAAEYGKPCSIVYAEGRSVISCEATDTPQNTESWQYCPVRYTVINTLKNKGDNIVAEHAAPTLDAARKDARRVAYDTGLPCAILYFGLDNAPLVVDLNYAGIWRELKTK